MACRKRSLNSRGGRTQANKNSYEYNKHLRHLILYDALPQTFALFILFFDYFGLSMVSNALEIILTRQMKKNLKMLRISSVGLRPLFIIDGVRRILIGSLTLSHFTLRQK